MTLSDKGRVLECLALRKLAQELKAQAESTGAGGHNKTILGFAAAAEKYANQIRDAKTPEAAEAIVQEAAKKKSQWDELAQMLSLASAIENNEEAAVQEALQEAIEMEELQKAALEEAEGKLRAQAEGLRSQAGKGKTKVFDAIAGLADKAEEGLAEFLAAEEPEDKWKVYQRIEEDRAGWLTGLATMQTSLHAETEAENRQKKNDPAFQECAEDDEFQDCTTEVAAAVGGTTCRPSVVSADVMNLLMADFDIDGGFCAPVAPKPAAQGGGYNANGDKVKVAAVKAAPKAPPPRPAAVVRAEQALADSALAPEELRKQIVSALTEEKDGLLAMLRITVPKLKEDDRFESVHEDAGQLLEQMELAAGAVVLPKGLAGDKLKDQMRNALAATGPPKQPLKKAAFAIQKHDIYVRDSKGPRLTNEHPDFLECAKVCVELATYLQKEAQQGLGMK